MESFERLSVREYAPFKIIDPSRIVVCIGNMLNGIVTDLQRSSNRRHWTYEDTGTGYIDPNGNDGTDWDAFHDHCLRGRSLYTNYSVRGARGVLGWKIRGTRTIANP